MGSVLTASSTTDDWFCPVYSLSVWLPISAQGGRALGVRYLFFVTIPFACSETAAVEEKFNGGFTEPDVGEARIDDSQFDVSEVVVKGMEILFVVRPVYRFMAMVC